MIQRPLRIANEKPHTGAVTSRASLVDATRGPIAKAATDCVEFLLPGRIGRRSPNLHAPPVMASTEAVSSIGVSGLKGGFASIAYDATTLRDFLPLPAGPSFLAHNKIASAPSSASLRPLGCAVNRLRPFDHHRDRNGAELETQD